MSWGQKSTNAWGKTGNTTWGKSSNNNANNQNANKQTGNNTNKSTPGQWGTTTNKTGTTGTTTGWGSNKTQQTTTTFQTQNREQYVTPVCTIDLPISPSTVNLAISRQGEGIPTHYDFTVNHISQMEIFNKYTIDEIRYYDYLVGGFIDKVKPDAIKNTSLFGNKTGQTGTAFGQKSANQEIIQKNITPWRRKPEDLKDPPLPTQKQPFGALPASTINAPPDEIDDPLPKKDIVPEDPGFRDNITLYQHLISTSAPETATPGLHQLNPQKIQIKTPKEIALKSKPSNLHRFRESSENYNDDQKTDGQKYSYIPELTSIHDDDVIYNFTVIDRNYGSIVFPDGFKAKQIDPEKNISFEDRKVSINLSNVDKRNLGIDKNFLSIVTLKNVFPSEGRKQESLREYETDLIKFCSDHNLGFISYSYDDGILMFSVPSLSVFPIEIE